MGVVKKGKGPTFNSKRDTVQKRKADTWRERFKIERSRWIDFQKRTPRHSTKEEVYDHREAGADSTDGDPSKKGSQHGKNLVIKLLRLEEKKLE